jgi:hypothetical protein
LSRIIKTESAAKERISLIKAVALAIRQLAIKNEVDDEARDLVAFIILALNKISGTIDASVTAWEKRGYWVKADKFRMEWGWTGIYSGKLRIALFSNDWSVILNSLPLIAQKLGNIVLPKSHSIGFPWKNAWNELAKSDKRPPG